jgi:hypothetical protein
MADVPFIFSFKLQEIPVQIRKVPTDSWSNILAIWNSSYPLVCSHGWTISQPVRWWFSHWKLHFPGFPGHFWRTSTDSPKSQTPDPTMDQSRAFFLSRLFLEIGERVLTYCSDILRFPKLWGYPHFNHQFYRWIFHERNHPAIGYPYLDLKPSSHEVMHQDVAISKRCPQIIAA